MYLGDIMWALMIFLIVCFIFRNRSTLWVAAVAITFCFVTEISQLYQATWINGIRMTTLGSLVLGFGFLWSDLLLYTAGITLGVFLEKFFIKKAGTLELPQQ